MLKKSLASFLAAAMLPLLCAQQITAHERTESSAQLTQKVKSGILKLGVGPEARIQVKLRDRTKLAGYIGEANQESFVLIDSKSGVSRPVSYTDVTSVKGHNSRTAVNIAIGIAVGVVVALIALTVSGYLRN